MELRKYVILGVCWILFPLLHKLWLEWLVRRIVRRLGAERLRRVGWWSWEFEVQRYGVRVRVSWSAGGAYFEADYDPEWPRFFVKIGSWSPPRIVDVEFEPPNAQEAMLTLAIKQKIEASAGSIGTDGAVVKIPAGRFLRKYVESASQAVAALVCSAKAYSESKPSPFAESLETPPEYVAAGNQSSLPRARVVRSDRDQ